MVNRYSVTSEQPYQENETLRVKDRRDDFPVFIHSELDDYGLTPIEFRVYARLARRAGQHGKHSESVPNMAKEFEVSPRTIQYGLKLLIACRLVTRHQRPGKTDEYSLNPRNVWRNKSDVKVVRLELKPSGATTAGTRSGATRDGGATGEGGVVQPETGVVVQPETDEGYPSEGTPNKGTPKEKNKDPEPPFASAVFGSALQDLEQHRKEIHKPLKPMGRRKLYKQLLAMGEDRAIAAIEHSIANGYQGVFEPNGNGSKNGNGTNGNGTYQQNHQQQASAGSAFQFKPKSIIR